MVDIELFTSILPADAIITAQDDLKYYGRDSCREFKPSPSCILLPNSHAQVAEIVKISAANKLALVPSGGRTGLSGGATATNGEVVISLARMNRILGFDFSSQVVTCQAGVTTQAIQEAAAQHGLLYPVDFASKGSSQIGGNIATNAGGVRVIRYGSTRDWVLGLKVVTGCGDTLSLNPSALFKDATGYNLLGLFIGSEGTLGIITEATIKLSLPAAPSQMCLAAIATGESSIQILRELRKAGLIVSLIEYFEHNALSRVCNLHNLRPPFSITHPAYLLIDIEIHSDLEATLERLISVGLVQDIVMAQASNQRTELLGYRERIAETIGKLHTVHKNDVSVPVSKIPDFLSEFKREFPSRFPELESVVFGHIGDGNLHINALKPDCMETDRFYELASEVDELTFGLVTKLSGSISAEHGVGLLKRDYLHLSRTNIEIELMRKIKATFDPANILNPGKVLGASSKVS